MIGSVGAIHKAGPLSGGRVRPEHVARGFRQPQARLRRLVFGSSDEPSAGRVAQNSQILGHAGLAPGAQGG